MQDLLNFCSHQLPSVTNSEEGAHGLVFLAVGGFVVVSGTLCSREILETYVDGPSLSCLALIEDEPHLVAEHPTAVGDRHIGGHRSVRAPVVAVWVIADADGRL